MEVLEVEVVLEVLPEAEVVLVVVLVVVHVHLLVVFVLAVLSLVVLVLVLDVHLVQAVDLVLAVVEDDQVLHPSSAASRFLQSESVAPRENDPSPKEQLEVLITKEADSVATEAADEYFVPLLQVLRRW